MLHRIVEIKFVISEAAYSDIEAEEKAGFADLITRKISGILGHAKNLDVITINFRDLLKHLPPQQIKVVVSEPKVS